MVCVWFYLRVGRMIVFGWHAREFREIDRLPQKNPGIDRMIAALEYAVKTGPKALKLVSDSELLVRQIKGIYKVKNAVLQDLHARAKELIAQLDWFSIGHAFREHNQEADRLANEAMDKGTGRSSASVVRTPSPANASTHVAADAPLRGPLAQPNSQQEFVGIVRQGKIELINGTLAEGTRVQVRVRK